MKANKIFHWIWRLNALLILAVGVLVLGIISYTLYQPLKDILRRKPLLHSSNMVNVEENINIDSEWTLSGFREVSKTAFMVSAVFSKQEYDVSYKEKETSSVRNYLFLNSTDKSTRWLVPTNKYLFLNESEIKENNASDSKAILMRYNLVKSDSNSDARLTFEDKKTFAISDINGGNYTELIDGIDDFLGEQRQDADTLLFFYRSNEKNFIAEIKLAEKKVVQTKELPKIQ